MVGERMGAPDFRLPPNDLFPVGLMIVWRSIASCVVTMILRRSLSEVGSNKVLGKPEVASLRTSKLIAAAPGLFGLRRIVRKRDIRGARD